MHTNEAKDKHQVIHLQTLAHDHDNPAIPADKNNNESITVC